MGYVLWLIRGGALLGSVLSSLPAWKLIDPLPVLASVGAVWREEDEDDEDESLEEMVQRESPKAKDAEPGDDSG